MTTPDLHAVPRDLLGRHALVCGASAGIGRASALALAARGASITALARRADRLDSLLPELRAAGAAEARALVADLDRRADLADRVEALIEAHGPVHIVINNTGGPPGGPLLQAEPEAFSVAFGRHILAAHILARVCVPGMQASGFGRIVNVVSTSVYEPIPNLGVSNTIRGAMGGWAKSLSRELPEGVTINNVLPGFTDTERLTSLAEGRARREGSSSDQVRANWLAQVPEGRLGRPEETAAAVAFLCSPSAAYIRGVSLPVDGGRLRGI
ncbi:MAG: short-chain dehydrogenase [Deltaproteobacteria bacterium]|nr:short-chain dehydrogenase [Deltaproteobacteria bacterium]HCH62761.1 short-chain dehydrogenase [Deltaproteobacteria bacterium]